MGKKILVLGGTVFLGRHVVEAALAAGCEVAVFNRGSRTLAFAGAVEPLRGDRDGDLSALRGRHFDAVVDCSGYTPEQVKGTAIVLRDQVAHYVFVSTISVYARFAPGLAYDESAPVTTDATGYGGGKARAEEALKAAYAERATCVRPGLIVGPYDPTGRFTYWPLRMARGGQVLAPGRPERPVQCIDARDLAAWCIQLALQHRGGVFHGVGPTGTMADMLAACQQAAGAESQLRWCTDAELVQADVAPWTGLPLWIPESDASFGGMLLASDRRARQAGLQTRSWLATAQDTLTWARTTPQAAQLGSALAPEAEAALLESVSR